MREIWALAKVKWNNKNTDYNKVEAILMPNRYIKQNLTVSANKRFY